MNFILAYYQFYSIQLHKIVSREIARKCLMHPQGRYCILNESRSHSNTYKMHMPIPLLCHSLQTTKIYLILFTLYEINDHCWIKILTFYFSFFYYQVANRRLTLKACCRIQCMYCVRSVYIPGHLGAPHSIPQLVTPKNR